MISITSEDKPTAGKLAFGVVAVSFWPVCLCRIASINFSTNPAPSVFEIGDGLGDGGAVELVSGEGLAENRLMKKPAAAAPASWTICQIMSCEIIAFLSGKEVQAQLQRRKR